MTPTTAYWQPVLDRLQKSLDEVSFKNWIAPIVFSSYEAGTITVKVKNNFFRQWIASNYLKAIEESCRETLEGFKEMVLIIDGREFDIDQELKAISEQHRSISFQEAKEAPQAPTKPRSWLIDRFVIGAENRVAHAVAVSVAEGLNRRAQWPIVYIYGPCGIGKTHLLKGIAEKAQAVRCCQAMLSAETFLNMFLASLKDRSMESFRRKFRSLRLLIIDDFDFLFKGDKTASREELSFILDSIAGSGGCVIFGANKSPKEMRSENAKLDSLLSSGLTAQMKAPEGKTFQEIVAFRAGRKGMILDESCAKAITSRCSNVREAIGILTNLKLLSRVYQRPVDREMLEEAWGHVGIKLPPALTIRHIQEEVAKHFRLDPKLLNGKGRTRKLTYPRQIAMFLCREFLPDKPLTEIARAFGKDHTTVIYACEQIAKDLAAASDLEVIRTSITRA